MAVTVTQAQAAISSETFDVYTWYIRGISWYIHGYSELSEARFRRRPVLLVSFNVHTRVGDQECFIPRATMAIAPGEKAAHKKAQPDCRQRSSPVAGGGGDGSSGGGVAGGFPFS
jgi:hypothetical protein